MRKRVWTWALFPDQPSGGCTPGAPHSLHRSQSRGWLDCNAEPPAQAGEGPRGRLQSDVGDTWSRTKCPIVLSVPLTRPTRSQTCRTCFLLPKNQLIFQKPFVLSLIIWSTDSPAHSCLWATLGQAWRVATFCRRETCSVCRRSRDLTIPCPSRLSEAGHRKGALGWHCSDWPLLLVTRGQGWH